MCCCLFKCCLKQLICYALILTASVIGFILLWKLYLEPWGQDQINSSSAIGNSTTGSDGINLEWPTTTTGVKKVLDTYAGNIGTGIVATSVALSVGSSMLWASLIPTIAAATSVTSGIYEMIHVFEQAQFISLLGQLETNGAPRFFLEFTTDLSWTNFNLDRGGGSENVSRRLETSVNFAQQVGVERYAAMIGVDPQDMFYYTLVILVIALVLILALFLLILGLYTLVRRRVDRQMVRKLFRKVIWAALLVLLLSQYSVSMTGSFQLRNDHDRVIAASVLLLLVVGVLSFGVFVVWKYPDELRDIGTWEHEQRPFCSKYSILYEDFNFENRFFFVPKIVVAVATGAIIGGVSGPITQILLILGVHLMYLTLLLLREPFLYRFFFIVAVTSVYFKVALLLMMLMMAQQTSFPENYRNILAYCIIGVNMVLFSCLIVRQLYVVVRKLEVLYRRRRAQQVDFTQIESQEMECQPREDYHELQDVKKINYIRSTDPPAETTGNVPLFAETEMIDSAIFPRDMGYRYRENMQAQCAGRSRKVASLTSRDSYSTETENLNDTMLSDIDKTGSSSSRRYFQTYLNRSISSEQGFKALSPEESAIQIPIDSDSESNRSYDLDAEMEIRTPTYIEEEYIEPSYSPRFHPDGNIEL